MKFTSKTSKFTPAQKRAYDVRHYPVRPHVGVGGIITWQNHVCIVKRKYNPNKGQWAIPGGHLRLGEPAAQGALRECMEETGLQLQVNQVASVIDKIDRDSTGKIEYHYVLCDYWMKIKQEFNKDHPSLSLHPDPDADVEDVKFVHFSELKNYNLTKTVKELFKNLKIMV